MLQVGTLLLYCTASWCMGRNTAYQKGGEVKYWLGYAVICCRTHWALLNTVLMQGKKKYIYRVIWNHSKQRSKSELWWSLPNAKHSRSWNCPCRRPRSCSHHLNPVAPVDSGRHCSLAHAYFTWREKKQEESTLWIWRSRPLLEGFVHFVSRAYDLGSCRRYVWDALRCSDIQVELFWQV